MGLFTHTNIKTGVVGQTSSRCPQPDARVQLCISGGGAVASPSEEEDGNHLKGKRKVSPQIECDVTGRLHLLRLRLLIIISSDMAAAKLHQ